jgi:hypothetical protein
MASETAEGAAKILITARGDLDCDGVTSLFSVEILADTTTGDIQRSALEVARALE